MNLIKKYFLGLEKDKLEKLFQLFEIYKFWNSKINLISRKDIDYFYLHHVLHSLSIAKFFNFSKDSLILDAGTGGGFPGIPLSIIFPEVNFHLVDSISKKINVVENVKNELGLINVFTHNKRMESLNMSFDFVVCRALAPVQTIVNWIGNNISKNQKNSFENGLLCLKGGDLCKELKPFERAIEIHLNSLFKESFFQTKKLVHLPL